MSNLDFRLRAVRLTFRAIDSIYFPEGKAGNVFRGALGNSLRQLVCSPDCPGAKMCDARDTCAYARLFEPTISGQGPSGFGDPPRPFVLRAFHLDSCVVRPGEDFSLDLHLFDLQEASLLYMVMAFEQVVSTGMGTGRGRAKLHTVQALGMDRRLALDGRPITLSDLPEPLIMSLQPLDRAAPQIRLRFVTPTEIKADNRWINQPQFPVLFARLRDRISTLRWLYGEGPLEIDFIEMQQRSQNIRMTECRIERQQFERRSGHTGHSHPLSGFVGEAAYEGELAEFIPFLVAGWWTGVGNQTVWGKGAFHIVP